AIVDSRHFDQRSTSLKTSANRRIIAAFVLFFFCVAPSGAHQQGKAPGEPRTGAQVEPRTGAQVEPRTGAPQQEKPHVVQERERDATSPDGSSPDASSGDKSGGAQEDKITPEEQAVLDHISADSMRGHLSFIASDLLEGRFTPSRGLDVAALYIAAQFRREELDPAGDDGYFQTAAWLLSSPDMNSIEFTINHDKQTITIKRDHVSFQFEGALDLNTSLFKINYGDAAVLSSLTTEQVSGKAV